MNGENLNLMDAVKRKTSISCKVAFSITKTPPKFNRFQEQKRKLYKVRVYLQVPLHEVKFNCRRPQSISSEPKNKKRTKQP